MACFTPWLPAAVGSGSAHVSRSKRMSDWASSNKQRTPSHLSLAASSRALLNGQVIRDYDDGDMHDVEAEKCRLREGFGTASARG